MIAWLQERLARWLLTFLPQGERLARDPKRNLSTRERYVVYTRDRGHCRYCGQYVSIQECEIDHVWPWTRGGETSVENSVTSCRSCNRRKGSKPGIWPLPLSETGYNLLGKLMKIGDRYVS